MNCACANYPTIIWYIIGSGSTQLKKGIGKKTQTLVNKALSIGMGLWKSPLGNKYTSLRNHMVGRIKQSQVSQDLLT